jgi:hypothetical protein
MEVPLDVSMMMNIGSFIKMRNAVEARFRTTQAVMETTRGDVVQNGVDQEGCPRQMMSITITVFCSSRHCARAMPNPKGDS